MRDAGLTDLRLGLVVKSTERAIMSAKADALASHSLNVPDYVLLMVCTDRPGTPIPVAAKIAMLSEHEVEEAVAGLEQRGLVRTTTSGLIPTAAGRELAGRADVTVREVESRIGDAITDDERTQLVDVLERMVDALD